MPVFDPSLWHRYSLTITRYEVQAGGLQAQVIHQQRLAASPVAALIAAAKGLRASEAAVMMTKWAASEAGLSELEQRALQSLGIELVKEARPGYVIEAFAETWGLPLRFYTDAHYFEQQAG